MFGFYDTYFKFFGMNISYYGLLIAVAMAFGLYLACINAKLRKLKTNDLITAACFVIPIAIFCAHIYYFLTRMSQFNSFWQIFEFWNGIAINGAIIGGALGLGLYCLIFKKNFFDIADIVVPTLILGQAIGRVGCYFGGCCYGMTVTDPSLMWFPLSVNINGVWHLATMFYECIWDLLGFIVLILLLRKFKLKQRGAVSAWYLIIYGVGRIWIEALRAGDGGDSIKLGGVVPVSIVTSVLFVLAGIGILVYYFVRNKKQPKKEEKQENIVIKQD